MYVYLVDTYGYDARGGNASVHSTLDGAKQSRPWVTEWEHCTDNEGTETWTQSPDPGSAQDIEEITLVEVGP